jgi:uncharacterized cupin superfamily protein
MEPKRIMNLEKAKLADNGDGKHFVAKIARLAPALGSTGLGCTLTVLPPGKRAYPFHRHHVIDEMFYVLEGEGTCRIGEESLPVRAGDLIAAPAGAEPHQIVNTSAKDLRYLAFSTIGSVDICEYPDSGKMAAAAGIRNADFTTATFKAMGRVQPAGYFEGEAPQGSPPA